MTFEDKTLLLGNQAAREIFQEIQTLDIRDIHTHVDLEMVLANENAPDPWTALCKGDHYVSSIIESLGGLDRRAFFAPETDPYEKWEAYARVFPLLIGNQIRDWMKITLRELGVEQPFNLQNARAIWDRLGATLQDERWRPVEIFKNAPIVLMSTTDNPVDTLDGIEHSREPFGDGYWMPAWRPDPFFNLVEPAIPARSWLDWLGDLERATDKSLRGDFTAFQEALATRHDHFAARGCRVSDYGVGIPYGHDVEDSRASAIYEKVCSDDKLIEPGEAADFQAYMLRFSMGLDYEKGWVSQIHYGPLRNQRLLAAEFGGADSGCDTVGGSPDIAHLLHDLLNHFDSPDADQHKIFLYSLDKTDWPKIAGLSRVFPSVYPGISWWYFDSVSGMLEFLRAMPDMGAGLAKTGPFVTDARNIFTLVPRNEVYRRCLSSVLGEAVETRGDSVEEAIELARYLCVDHITNLI